MNTYSGTILSCLIWGMIFHLTMFHSMQAQESDFNEAWQKTSDHFHQTLHEHNIVGGALLFLENGEVKGSNFYGKAEISENREVDEETIFHWASNTKTLTAIGIMQLRDHGLLSLDDPLTKYLPELRKVHNPYGSMDEITIKMALNHSTGFRNPTWPWGGDEEWHPFEPNEWSQLVAMFPYTKIHFEPGTQYSYSNPAIIFLGRIIEEITRDNYESYITKNILQPLGMDRTYFNETPNHLLPHRTNSYTLHEGTPEPNGLDFNTGITVSNGGMNAPLSDMVKYVSYLSGVPANYDIIERPTLEEMWEEQLPADETDGVRSSVGLSFFAEEFDGMKVIGHTGTQWSHYSFFYIHPESKTAVIGVTNTDSTDDSPDMYEIRQDISHFVFRNLFSLYK